MEKNVGSSSLSIDMVLQKQLRCCENLNNKNIVHSCNQCCESGSGRIRIQLGPWIQGYKIMGQAELINIFFVWKIMFLKSATKKSSLSIRLWYRFENIYFSSLLLKDGSKLI